jgi:hypothetical protein
MTTTHSPNFWQESLYRDVNTVSYVRKNIFTQLSLFVKSTEYVSCMDLENEINNIK